MTYKRLEFNAFYPIYIFTDKFGGFELPHPKIIKLEENTNYLQ